MFEVIADSLRPRVPHVLLIDDEPQVRHAYARVLRSQGIKVLELPDGRDLGDALTKDTFDAVVSDICMPGPSGIDVLRTVHRVDPDLPVVLVTAGGDLRSAVEAVEHGAHRYLLKPVPPAVLGSVVTDAVRIRRLAAMQRRAFELYGSAAVENGDLPERFERALATLHMAFQPIVGWGERSVYAHEALVRCEEPTLKSPDLLLAAADKLGRGLELGRLIRRQVAEKLATTSGCVFVNLHPRDLDDPELTSSDSPLSRYARRVVLEVTERASLESATDLRARLNRLRALGFRLAIDDLGAGYAGLTWFTTIEPDVVKLDMSLTRNLHQEPTKRRLIKSMTALCGELGILVVAEGVELAEERDALVELGCDLLQGYLFARPGPPFPAPVFDEPVRLAGATGRPESRPGSDPGRPTTNSARRFRLFSRGRAARRVFRGVAPGAPPYRARSHSSLWALLSRRPSAWRCVRVTLSGARSGAPSRLCPRARAVRRPTARPGVLAHGLR